MQESDQPRTGPRHEPERVYERASDAAEAADRPLESKSSHEPLSTSDEVGGQAPPPTDPHHALNSPVGTPDPDADSDPYRPATPEDDDEHASGVRGSGERSQDG
jgi:hypothetical protein